jgi:hypothetical protein
MTGIGELGTTLAVTNNRRTLRRNTTTLTTDYPVCDIYYNRFGHCPFKPTQFVRKYFAEFCLSYLFLNTCIHVSAVYC